MFCHWFSIYVVVIVVGNDPLGRDVVVAVTTPSSITILIYLPTATSHQAKENVLELDEKVLGVEGPVLPRSETVANALKKNRLEFVSVLTRR